jgi:type II secretory pathway pseudopilin PulG
MAKKPSKQNKSDRIVSIAQVIGFMLAIGVAFYLLIFQEVDVFIVSIVIVVGMLTAAILPLVVQDQHRQRARRQALFKAEARKKTSGKSKSNNPSRSRFIPHVLTEPVPDNPPETILSIDSIKRKARNMTTWTDESEQIVIQLLQVYKPDNCDVAQHHLQKLDLLIYPFTVIACLVYADGDLKKLESVVKINDHRDYQQILHS